MKQESHKKERGKRALFKERKPKKTKTSIGRF